MVKHREEVHVWQSWVDTSTAVLAALESSLDDGERARAARFLFEKDRSRYVFSRGLLRHILATYLAAKPKEIAFAANGFGKPFLDGPFKSSSLCFNVSHSEELVVVAVAYDRHVGIDVEFIRPVSDIELVARRCFTNTELQ